MLSIFASRRRIFPLFIAILLSLITTKLMMSLPQWATWEERSAQSVWSVLAKSEIDRRWVVVDIDETSLKRVGAWPWSREVMSQLLGQVLARGASVAVVDAVFPDPRPGDQSFRQVLTTRQIVLAQLFSDAAHDGKLANQGILQGASSASQDCSLSKVVQSNSYLANTPDLGQFPVGHISPSVDQDGTVRHFPPVVCYEKKLYPSLILAGLSAATGITNTWRWEREVSWWGPDAWVISDDLPGIRVPVDQAGLARLSFLRERSAYSAISAHQLLEDPTRVNLDGAFVIVGASAFGLADAIPTPQSGLSTGMEVHLQVASALLDQEFTFTPQAAWLIESALAIFASISMIFWVLKWAERAAWIIAWACLLVVFEWGLFVLGVWGLSWWIPPLALMAYTLCLGAMLAIYAHRTSWQDKRLLSEHLASFIDPIVARNLERDLLSSEIVAQEKDITVLVVDIVGFTPYSDQHPAAVTTDLLQTFFTQATRIAQVHGGVVDKFIGDAVMILFNANGACSDHAKAALACAADVAAWSQIYLQDPSRELNIAMGISTGVATVGQFGDKTRRTHTALGTIVTKAFRLERLCRDLHQRIVVSQETIVAVRGDVDPERSEVFSFREISYSYFGAVPLPGFSAVYEVYVAK